MSRSTRALVLIALALEVGCNCGSSSSAQGDTDSGSGGVGTEGDTASDPGTAEGTGDGDTDSGGEGSGGPEDDDVPCGYVPGDLSPSVPVGYVGGLAAGDLDGDGLTDLVVARASHDQPGAASVLLAEAPGEYGEPIDFPAPTNAVGVGDFDEDGSLDVLAIIYPGTATVLTLNDGALEVVAESDTGSNCTQVEVADIDGDGHLDYAVICILQETTTEPGEGAALFRGLGDGTFERMDGMGMQEPHGLHLADVDGDERLDLLHSASAAEDDTDPEFQYYCQTTDGFVLEQAFEMPWGADPATGDFDEDGDLDVVVAQESGTDIKGLVAYFRNEGGVLVEPVVFDTVGAPFKVGVSDFDLDGHLDVAATGDGYVEILLGDGTGWFESVALHGCGGGRELAMAHVDGDERLDLLHSAAGGVGVRFTDEHFFGARPAVTSVESVRHLELVDLDADGHLDLAALSPNGVEVQLGRGDGTFQPAWAVARDPIDDTRGLTAGDLDGDGALDLVAATEAGAILYAGHGDGTFEPEVTLVNQAAVGIPRFGDLDGDGIDDVVVPREHGFMIWLGSGESRSVSSDGEGTGSVALDDVDGDGSVDLVVGSGNLAVYYGDGSGDFSGPVVVEPESSIYGLVMADLDGDGDRDGVAVGPRAQAGTTFRGLSAFDNEDGAFVPSISTDPTGMNIHSVAAADFNADGHDDIVTFEHASSAISLWFGPDLTHAGVFPVNGVLGYPITDRDGVTVGDVDEDGVLDILVADPWLDRVVVATGQHVHGDACR